MFLHSSVSNGKISFEHICAHTFNLKGHPIKLGDFKKEEPDFGGLSKPDIQGDDDSKKEEPEIIGNVEDVYDKEGAGRDLVEMN